MDKCDKWWANELGWLEFSTTATKVMSLNSLEFLFAEGNTIALNTVHQFRLSALEPDCLHSDHHDLLAVQLSVHYSGSLCPFPLLWGYPISMPEVLRIK